MPTKKAVTPRDIKSLARIHTETAIRTLAGIMRQPRAAAAARVAAANSLLDRGWGKAPSESKVNVNTTGTITHRHESISDALAWLEHRAREEEDGDSEGVVPH